MTQRTILKVQNDLAHSSTHGSEIVWDSLSADQSQILKEKIKIIIPDDSQHQGEVEKARSNLFRNVWSQRKYTNRVLLSSVIYVMVTGEKKHNLAPHSTDFTFHPVMRTRKCLSSNNSSDCCMIFVDEHSRIYQNWQEYLKNNILPSGTMVAPLNGVYMLNEHEEVKLEICNTPDTKSNKSLETAIGVGGLISGTAPLALSMFMPIAAPVMLTSTVVSLATSAYATVRSVKCLKDRHKHGQSNSLADREARSKWLGVASGVAGLGASGAMKALTYANKAGKGVPLMAKVAVGGINVSSLVVSGTDIVNTIYDLHKYDDGPNSLDILQLASSLLVFTHSINNIALVSKIPSRGRNAKIRRAIRQQTRASINKISNECTRRSKTGTKSDLIRLVNDIPPPDTFIIQITKLLAQAVKQAASNTYGVLPQLLNSTAKGEYNPLPLIAKVGSNFVHNILDSNSFIDLISTIAKFVSEKAFILLLNLTKTFMDNCGDDVNKVLATVIPTEKVLYEIFMLCVEKYSPVTHELLESKRTEILHKIENYFKSLNPIVDNQKNYECNVCKGYYSLSRL